MRKWGARFERKRVGGLDDAARSGRPPRFSPSSALELVKRACELPDHAGRSLAVWTCAELARALRNDGVVEGISPHSVQRILESQKLKPWRVHHWLSAKVPRHEDFYARATNIRELYTRLLEPHERVLSLDEKTLASVSHAEGDRNRFGRMGRGSRDPRYIGAVGKMKN
ncbi:MAG: helix-turn-helix domain-containing protein [Myxococcaceae bacterium]